MKNLRCFIVFEGSMGQNDENKLRFFVVIGGSRGQNDETYYVVLCFWRVQGSKCRKTMVFEARGQRGSIFWKLSGRRQTPLWTHCHCVHTIYL